MLRDLGLHRGDVNGHYDNYTRNSVSALQQLLSSHGYYTAPPHGRWNSTTRDALLADPQIPTVQV